MLFLVVTGTSFAQSYFELTFTVGLTQYKAMLVMYEGSTKWPMRVRYYSTDCRCTRLIEKDMRVEDTASGIRIAGYWVRNAYTQARVYDYNADNFYLYYDDYGNLKLYNYDDGGVLISVSVSEVPSWESNKRLAPYNWKL